MLVAAVEEEGDEEEDGLSGSEIRVGKTEDSIILSTLHIVFTFQFLLSIV